MIEMRMVTALIEDMNGFWSRNKFTDITNLLQAGVLVISPMKSKERDFDLF